MRPFHGTIAFPGMLLGVHTHMRVSYAGKGFLFFIGRLTSLDVADSLFILSVPSLQAAVETVARKRKASSSSSSSSRPPAGTKAPLPLVGPPPPAHPVFLPVRQGLLYSPVVMRAVRVVLSNYAGKVGQACR